MVKIGSRFGRLLVTERDGYHIYPSGNKAAKYKVICDCGVEKTIVGKNLESGKTKSCGCLYKEQATIRGKRMIHKRFSDLWLMDEDDYKP